MWRRLAIRLRTLDPTRLPLAKPSRYAAGSSRYIRRPFPVVLRGFSSDSVNLTKRVEDVMPIATVMSGKSWRPSFKGKNILEIDYPVGPFGTKESPAVIKSYYDKRIVGCPGGEGEDEHDVVWFWLEKGKPHECPVCSQYFTLEVVGPGGSPDGHGDDEEDEDHH